MPCGDQRAVAVTFALTIDVKATRDLARVQAEALAAAQAIAGRWQRSLGSSVDGGLSSSDIVDRVRGIDAVVHVAVSGMGYLPLAEWEFGVSTGITVNVAQAGGA